MSHSETSLAPQISEWLASAESAEKAIVRRNFRQLKLSVRKSRKCFKEIKARIRGGYQMSATESETARTASSVWSNVIEELPQWMSEVQSRIKRRESGQSNGRKLGKAYQGSKTSGRKLRVNAR